MSIPKEPRQQMINLMYLVLTALLALNVSSEVLNAFKLVNDGLQVSNNAFDESTETLMAKFASKNSFDPIRTGPYYKDAQQITAYMKEFNTLVEDIKTQLIEESGGIQEDGSLKGKKNVDVPTRLMVEKKNGETLEQEINQLKSKLLALPSLDSLNEADLASLNKALALSTEYDREAARRNGKDSWAAYHFDHVPVVAAVTLLTKIQGDAKAAESMILESIYQNVDGPTYIFDDVAAKVVSPNSYILTDQQKYEASIFMAGTNKTQTAEIFIGKFKDDVAVFDETGNLKKVISEFPLKDGFTKVETEGSTGLFSEIPSTVGDKEYEGVIKVKKPGKSGVYDFFPFSFNYQSAQSSVVVSPDLMNVLYIGIDNPVSVSVPGFSAEDLTASIRGNGTLSGSNGTYNALPATPGTAFVDVFAVMPDGSRRKMGERQFRVKRAPDPIATIANLMGGPIKKGELSAQVGIAANPPAGVDFPFEYTVTGYTFSWWSRGDFKGEVKANNPYFASEVKKMLSEVKPGDQVYFEDITAQANGDIGHRKLNPISFRIKN